MECFVKRGFLRSRASSRISVSLQRDSGEPAQLAFDPLFVLKDDLIAMKRRAAADPRRRRSKALRDQADIALLERDVPEPDEGWCRAPTNNRSAARFWVRSYVPCFALSGAWISTHESCAGRCSRPNVAEALRFRALLWCVTAALQPLRSAGRSYQPSPPIRWRMYAYHGTANHPISTRLNGPHKLRGCGKYGVAAHLPPPFG